MFKHYGSTTLYEMLFICLSTYHIYIFSQSLTLLIGSALTNYLGFFGQECAKYHVYLFIYFGFFLPLLILFPIQDSLSGCNSHSYAFILKGLRKKFSPNDIFINFLILLKPYI